jgi:hypothetical protein
MRKFLIISVLICACDMQAQLWTNVIDSIPYESNSNFRRVVNDTVTNTLYIGGYFAKINQFTTNSILKYNGSTFDTLGSGLNDYCPGCATIVGEMTMFQNKLYVFGNFTKAGKYDGKFMARWNGSSWDSLENYPNGYVDKIDVYNNELYVAGSFDSIGGIAANCVAKFDGVNWYSLSYPLPKADNCVTAMKNYKGKLYISGAVSVNSSCTNISYYDGTNWIPWVGVSGDIAKYISGMTVIDTMLYVYGRFNSIAGTNCKGLAAYNGSKWFGFGSGLLTSSWETIYNVQKIDGEIYASGIFDKIEGVGTSNFNVNQSTNLAKFDGQKWCVMSPPFDNQNSGIIKYNNNLYAYGGFKKIGPDSVWGFVKWNGGNSTVACSTTIAITAGVVGLNELIEFGNLKLYPNPVKDNLTIEYTYIAIQQTQIDILNAQGQLVYASALTELKKQIDMSAYSQGIYFIKLRNNHEQKVFKIVKE